MCNRIFFGCGLLLLIRVIPLPFSCSCRFRILCRCIFPTSGRDDLLESSSDLAPFGSSTMHHRAKGHGRGYVHVDDNCKVFVGNLARTADPDAIAEWLGWYGYFLAFKCKVVIRGRTGIRRGLDALNRGGGPPPIKVAPPTGGLVPHIAFRNEAQIVSLQTRRGEPPRSSRLQRSNCGSPIYRFSTSSCPSG